MNDDEIALRPVERTTEQLLESTQKLSQLKSAFWVSTCLEVMFLLIGIYRLFERDWIQAVLPLGAGLLALSWRRKLLIFRGGLRRVETLHVITEGGLRLDVAVNDKPWSSIMIKWSDIQSVSETPDAVALHLGDGTQLVPNICFETPDQRALLIVRAGGV